MLESFFRGGGLAVGEQGKAEFDAMGGQRRGEFGGAAQEAHGVGGRGGGQAAVDEADEKARGGAQGRDFVVPAAEDVVGVVVGGIEGEGPQGVVFHEPGVFDFRAGVGIGPEFAVADGEREHVHGIRGSEGHGTLGEGEGRGAEAFFLGEVGRVEIEVGILPGDFLQEKRIVGVGGVGLEKKGEGGFGIKAGLGGEGFVEEGLCGGGQACGQEAGENEEGQKGAATGDHRRLIRGRGGRGCGAGECHRGNGGRREGGGARACVAGGSGVQM